jgi:FkbM family methyltransferase
MSIDGVKLDLQDDPRGGVVKIVLSEIEKTYLLNTMEFSPGDTVIDVGAHVGAVSIYLGKVMPWLNIYAFEPDPDNFNRLLRNIKANGVENITAINKAITADGRDVRLFRGPESNSGGASIILNGKENAVDVHSTTLPEVFRQYDIKTCRLLKIDCEGAEYEIFSSLPAALWTKIKSVRGEFHLAPDGDPKKLKDEVSAHIVDTVIGVSGL